MQGEEGGQEKTANLFAQQLILFFPSHPQALGLQLKWENCLRKGLERTYLRQWPRAMWAMWRPATLILTRAAGRVVLLKKSQGTPDAL